LSNLYYEKSLLESYSYVAGIDEVGRGPLAGPVVVACIVVDTNTQLFHGVDDSKKLSAKKRGDLTKDIINNCVEYSIALATHIEIDRDNILNATQLAMNRAFNHLKTNPGITIVDGKFYKPFEFNSKCIIKGDSKHFSISCASILAKVFRDNMMIEYSKRYPGYGFEDNKGYGTLYHRKAIQEIGPCPIHRKTFINQLKLC